MAYFLSFHGLSDELEKVTLLSLITGVGRFPILGKKLSQSYLINI